MREKKATGLEQFVNLYPLSKTLRFELIPVEGTEKTIQKHGIITEDKARAESYQKMKPTLDAFHRMFIDQSLSDVELAGLQNYYDLYNANEETKKTENYRKQLETVKKNLRKEVVSYFEKDKDYKNGLFGKKLIQSYIPQWKKECGEEWYFDESFVNFTTYFSGYNENRKNMYTSEAKSTAVAYRMIDENLPKFMNNHQIFARIEESEIAKYFPVISDELAASIFKDSLEEMFALDAFNALMTQAHIDAYNTIIGGYKEGEKLFKGLNGYINEYNQTHPKKRLPKMQMLYKQILSERSSASWLPDAFINASDLFSNLKEFCEYVMKFKERVSLPEEIENALQEILVCNTDDIYLRNDTSIGAISNEIFGYYGVIRDALELFYETNVNPEYRKKLSKAKNEKAVERIEKLKKAFVTGTKYFSVGELQRAVDLYMDTTDFDAHSEVKTRYFANCLSEYLSSGANPYVHRIKEAYIKVKDLLDVQYDSGYRLTDLDKAILKQFLDTVMELLHFCKPLYVRSDVEIKRDEVFYGNFMPLYEQLQRITTIYDKVRNFATQKAYSTEKIKLNFGIKGNFLNGWVESRTDTSDNGTQYGGYLFRKFNCIGEYDYFLGVSANTKLFRYFTKVPKTEASDYERLNYYQPKGQTVYGSAYKGNRPYSEDKVLLTKGIMNFVEQSKDKEFYEALSTYSMSDQATPSGCLNRVKNFSMKLYKDLLENETFKIVNEEVIQALKKTMLSMDRLKGAKEIADRSYHDFTEIIEAIDSLMANNVYQYAPVSAIELERALQDEKKPLYLFRITNKDLSYADRVAQGRARNIRGRDNLHTMYFKALMSGNQSVYDIGTGVIFYRPASLERKITHPAGSLVRSKNPSLKGKTSCFEYDLIKDKRYTEDKYQFHLSIVQNYSADKMKSSDYNTKVCNYLRNNPDINIIGIDRGERNLLYISMIDRCGNIVRDEKGQLIQYSLNTISGEYKNSEGRDVEFSTPYHTLLDNREEERKVSKQSWGSVSKIKDLKSGYMSQVVSHITRLMVQYNAVIVMEDLTGGFVGSRKKVDKQVYQNFEKALIQKLNYLVFKDVPAEDVGGLYNALQLADQFSSFRDLQKQSGFILYVPAWNTSRIDPVTGFVNLLKPKCDTLDQAREFFGRFKRISYNIDNDWFEFEFDYSDFMAGLSSFKSVWTICTHGKCRYLYNKSLNNNRGGYEEVNVTEEIKELFDKYGISYQGGNDLIDDINDQDKKVFFTTLVKYLKITLAIRYSNGKGGRDFILSPVADDNGHFFNSEEAAVNKEALPWDADANGAYNIARKGLLVLRSIDQSENLKDWTTKISNKQWLEFAQSFNKQA